LFGSPKKKTPAAAPSSFSSKRSSSPSGCLLRSWRLEGSNTGLHWTVLHEHGEEEGKNAFRLPQQQGGKVGAHRVLFAVDQPSPSVSASISRYSLFRLTQTGPDSRGSYALSLAGLELFGCLHACISDAGFLAHEERLASASLRALLRRQSDVFTPRTTRGPESRRGWRCPSPSGGGW